MKKLLCIILLFTGLTGFKPNSSRHITGKVSDVNSGLPGASVTVTGTTISATTDRNGLYAIDVPDGCSRLSFTYVGYIKQVVKIDKTDVVNVVLIPNNNSLNEVVTIGYGIAKRGHGRRSAGNANAEISIDAPVGNSDAKVAEVMPNQPLPVSGRPVSLSIMPTNDESYQPIVENGFNNAKDNPLSTFSVDVDNASYSNMRRFINNGQLPPADAVRIEEMINYFNYDLPGPKDSEL